jgi:hypothetical protein
MSLYVAKIQNHKLVCTQNREHGLTQNSFDTAFICSTKKEICQWSPVMQVATIKNQTLKRKQNNNKGIKALQKSRNLPQMHGLDDDLTLEANL